MNVEGQTAPAQSETVTPETTTVEAPARATDSDFTAFHEARLAERAGKPLPKADAPVEKAPAGAAPVQPVEEPKQVSKRQQQINDYERRIAEQTAEIARLKTPTPAAAPAQSTTPTSTDPAKPQTLTEIVSAPDPRAALLSEAEFFAAHPEAGYGHYTQYVTRHTAAVDRAAEHARSQQAHASEQQKARMDGFVAKLNATGDPEFGKKLSPEVSALTPIAWMKPGTPFTVDNAIAEEIIETGDTAPDLMLHLSQHPEALAALRATQNPRQLSAAIGRLVGRLEREAAAAETPQPKTVTEAPDPGTTLGRKPVAQADPVMAAAKAGDFKRFQEEKRARLLASRR